MEKRKTKCDFCAHKTASGCTTKPDSYVCRAAEMEFFRYINSQKQKAKMKRK